MLLLRIVVLVGFILGLTACGSSKSNADLLPGSWGESDLSVIDNDSDVAIKFGMTREEVEDLVGDPIDEIDFLGVLEYPGLKVHYNDQQQVAGIIIDDSTTEHDRYETARHIRYGITVDEVISRYGEPAGNEENFGTTTLTYILEKDNKQLKQVDDYLAVENKANLYTISMNIEKDTGLQFLMIADYAFTMNPTGANQPSGQQDAAATDEAKSTESMTDKPNDQPETVLQETDDPAAVGSEQQADEPASTAVTAVEVPDRYAAFLQEQGLRSAEQVIFYAEEDLNADGAMEAVLGFGYDGSNTDLKEMLVLGERDGEVKLLANPELGGGYMAEEIQLVHLQDRPQSVIEVALSNGGGMTGFELYSLEGDELVQLAYSASATGSGDDELMDNDQDGRYDGYMQNRGSYDVLYYDTSRIFELQNGDFVQTDTGVNLPEYPVDGQEAVEQLLILLTIDDGYSKGIAQRLTELCPTCAKDGHAWLDTDWEEYIRNTIVIEGGMKGNMQETQGPSKTESTSVLSRVVEGDTTGKLTFSLAQQDGKWTITKVSG